MSGAAVRSERPDPERVLQGLKPFQRDTVEYVFERLYRAPDSTRRFLVADEVGLGKTLVARGVIARAIDHLWEEVKRIDVVYICSNGDIARQNLNRLNITGRKDFAHATRMTLLPATLENLDGKLNFISFTPGTSFDLRSSLGVWQERVLLYWMLRDAWGLEGAGPLNVLQGGVDDKDWFRRTVRDFRQTSKLDESLVSDFHGALAARIARERAEGVPNDLRARWEELCERFSYFRRRVPQRDRIDRNRLVGQLRAMLASSCVKALEPDLVILDEFQRFRHLLTGEDEASLLARELFEYADETTEVRTLLLSATPYKMYTLYDEAEGEDHYTDFLRTLGFLERDPRRLQGFKALLDEYRREIYRLGESGTEGLARLKGEVETGLRRVMVRTERTSVAGAGDGMLREVRDAGLDVTASETATYLSLGDLARDLGQGDPLEYWKSAPYLLNFMDGYKLKEVFRSRAEGEDGEGLAGRLKAAPELLLSWTEIEAYREIDPGNARLRRFIDDTVGQKAWQLLWAPPCAPYYPLDGAYAEVDAARFTKRLVFSAWNVVPKVISTLVSYAAERAMICSHEEAAENTKEARRRRRPLLRFTVGSGRLTGMPVLGLLYPSAVLARLGDPLALVRETGADSPPPSVHQVLERVREMVGERLANLPRKDTEGGTEDEAWYWAAPLLLDMAENRPAQRAWFARANLPALWAGEADADGGDGESRWADHVAHAREFLEGSVTLGRRPADLPLVLAEMALSAPGVVSLRALSRIAGGEAGRWRAEVRDRAATVAWGFRSLFNQPEATALLRGRSPEEPYWRRVVEYCRDGCLQAVLDEYVHLLREHLGVAHRSDEEAVAEVAEAVRAALTLITSSMEVDEVRLDDPGLPIRLDRRAMRGHFALRFGVQKTEDGKREAREDQVRTAFNSPFWPFVLASTSVGQEGLDFHPYCHAVVHWNLPSNPVDLEQREGRVHRYKGHAVRKNLAERHRGALAEMVGDDPWAFLFERGRAADGGEGRGMSPYWLCPGSAHIERHVPALPLSRELIQLESLRRSLAVYRMVFGQPRQEDLVAYLSERLLPEEIESLRGLLQIDLRPPRRVLGDDGRKPAEM